MPEFGSIFAEEEDEVGGGGTEEVDELEGLLSI